MTFADDDEAVAAAPPDDVVEPAEFNTRTYCSPLPATLTVRNCEFWEILTTFWLIGLVVFASSGALIMAVVVVTVVLLPLPLFDCNRIFCDCHDLTPLLRIVGGPLAAFTDDTVVVPAAVAGAMGVGLVAVVGLTLFTVPADTSSFNFAELSKPIC